MQPEWSQNGSTLDALWRARAPPASTERPVDLWIEREGAECPIPPPSEEQVAARLARLRDWLEKGSARRASRAASGPSCVASGGDGPALGPSAPARKRSEQQHEDPDRREGPEDPALLAAATVGLERELGGEARHHLV